MKLLQRVYKKATKGAKEILAKLPTITFSQATGVYEWGKGGKMAQELINLVYDSPTAVQCLKIRQMGLYGQGFKDKSAADFVVNTATGKTANQLLKEIISWQAMYYGYARLIKNEVEERDGQFYYTDKVSSATHLEIDRIERKKNGGFIVYNVRKGDPEWKKDECTEYSAYSKVVDNTPVTNKQQGRVKYVFFRQPGSEHYPIPPYYAADSVLKADAEYSRLDFEQVDNGFQPAAMIIGPPMDNVTKKAELGGKTERGYVESQIESLYGSENRGGIFLVEKKEIDGKEISWDIKFFSALDNSEDLTNRIESCEARVSRAWGTPPVLVGLKDVAGLGDTKKLFDEITLFNAKLKFEQDMITEDFKETWPDLDWTIQQAEPISYIPPEVLAKMTDNEIRALKSLPPLEEEAPDAYKKVKDNLNSMSAIVANKILDSMSPRQKLALVGLEPDLEYVPQPAPTNGNDNPTPEV